MELYLNTAWRRCRAPGGPQLRPSLRAQQSSLLHLSIPHHGSTLIENGGEKVVGLAGNHRHAPLLAPLTIYAPHPEKMQRDSLETRVTQGPGHGFTPSFWIYVIFQLRDTTNRSSSYKHLTGTLRQPSPFWRNEQRAPTVKLRGVKQLDSGSDERF